MTEENHEDSKHKIKGKHALSYDSIFKGKKEILEDEFDYGESYIEECNNGQIFEADNSTNYSFEKENPYEATRLHDMRNEIYDILINEVKLDISTSRRRPNKEDFNFYYRSLLDGLDLKKFSYSEIFVELAFYFSDNIENMFKLLGSVIAQELIDKNNIKDTPNIQDIDFM
jgi:hypothetical protein